MKGGVELEKGGMTPLSSFVPSSTRIGLLQDWQSVKALTKVDNFSEDTKIIFFLLQKTFLAVQSHYVTQLPIHRYKSFRQLLLNQGHHRNIHCNTALFHIHVH